MTVASFSARCGSDFCDALWVSRMVRRGGDGPGFHGPAGLMIVARWLMRAAGLWASGRKARRMRDAVSITRAPSLMSRRRMQLWHPWRNSRQVSRPSMPRAPPPQRDPKPRAARCRGRCRAAIPCRRFACLRRLRNRNRASVRRVAHRFRPSARYTHRRATSDISDAATRGGQNRLFRA
jgi:hypothetical protein